MNVYEFMFTLLSAIGLVLVIQLIAAIIKIKIRYKFKKDIIYSRVFNYRIVEG